MKAWGTEGNNRIVENAYLAATVNSQTLTDADIAYLALISQS